MGNDGNFYGTTAGVCCGNSYGTVFQVTTNGTLTTLASFNGTNGANPYGALTLGNDGNFYGTTSEQNYSGFGTVFRMTTNGILTTLASFHNVNGSSRPLAGLTLGNDGNFYGTTAGFSGEGTVFRVTTNGVLTTLVSFNGTNGAAPGAALTLGNDGNFYGTTESGGSLWGVGGSAGYGTVFQVTTNGVLTTLVSFANTNGANPFAGLSLGTDGNFYGTTLSGGGSGNLGTVFQVTTNGVLTTLVSFNNTNGALPYSGLTLGNDGHFYGTTYSGGSSNSYGTVFRLLFTPAITVQPQSQTNITGATAAFLVSATSRTPIGYQWQKNGTNLTNGGNLSGATTNALSITGISDSAAGTYSVVLSNSDGSIASFNATLTVVDPPVITAQPTNVLGLQGTNVAFGVSLSSSPSFFHYQWLFNDTNILNATNATYAISSVSASNAGYYSLIVTNLAGSVTSSNAALTVVLSPSSRTNAAGGTVTLTATAFSPEPLNYQWQKNGTFLVNGGNISGATNSTLTLSSVSDADVANYSSIVSDVSASVTTSNAMLTVIDPPVITAQPTNVLGLQGTNIAFGVSLTGSALFFHYQWLFNDTNILNATNATYAISSIAANNAGNYSLMVANLAGSVTSSNAALTVVLSPSSRTNAAGSTVTLTATTFSPEPLNYHWQKNGAFLVSGGNISGATNSTLTLSSVSDADAASYRSVVSDAYTSVVTSNAVLTVIDPPVITAQPKNVLGLQGTNVVFGVSVSGIGPFSYQWHFNGTNLPTTAGAVAQTAFGFVYGAIVTNAGSDYTTVPQVQFIGGGGSGAAGTASVSNYQVTAITVTNAGSGYTSPPAVLIDAPTGLLIGQTNATLNLNLVTTVNAGGYFVVISNSYAGITSSVATLTIAYPPSISQQPQNQMVSSGSGANFSVTAAGTPPFSYQWWLVASQQSNATAVPVVTNGFVLTATITSGGTGYLTVPTVQFVGGSGSGARGTAVISNRMVAAINMTSAGSGYTTPPVIQIDAPTSIKLAGQTNSVLSLAAVNITNAGNYYVVVTNNYGSVTSQVAVLTVALPGYNQISGQFLGGGKMRLSFVGLAGANYALDRSLSLAPANWIPQMTNPADVNGELVFTNTPDPTTNNFWRIRSLP